MPQFWIATFFIILAVTELYQSIKEIDLPLPVYLVLGTILAISSNYQQISSFSLDQQISLTSSQSIAPTSTEVPPKLITAGENDQLD